MTLHEREEVGSTNDAARDLALADAPAGTAVLARRQSHGRGRAGRSWASPEGGLYLSVVLRPASPPHRWSLLPLALGAAVVDILRADGFPAALKWPNDVLLEGRKTGGLLLESRMGARSFVVAGIGLNLASAPAGVPGVACLAQFGRAPEPRALAPRIVDAFLATTQRLDDEGPAPTLADVRRVCATLGRKVAWEKGEGTAVDVAEDGALVVEAQDGARHRVAAGDVRLRTAP